MALDLNDPRWSPTPLMLGGLEVRATEYGTTKRRWVFPKERFFTYEPSDEWWCRKYGFGHEVTEYICMTIGNTIYMHPAAIKLLVDEMDRRNREKDEAMSMFGRDLFRAERKPKYVREE